MRWAVIVAAVAALASCANTTSGTAGRAEALCDALMPLSAVHAAALLDAPEAAQASGVRLLAGLEAACR
jgi:hypothetical protein